MKSKPVNASCHVHRGVWVPVDELTSSLSYEVPCHALPAGLSTGSASPACAPARLQHVDAWAGLLVAVVRAQPHAFGDAEIHLARRQVVRQHRELVDGSPGR